MTMINANANINFIIKGGGTVNFKAPYYGETLEDLRLAKEELFNLFSKIYEKSETGEPFKAHLKLNNGDFILVNDAVGVSITFE